jgi:asparagine synthase (glutamine-hydrolysing)
MTAIAGIQSQGSSEKVTRMLRKMSHRGTAWQQVFESHGTVLGSSGTKSQKKSASKPLTESIAQELVSNSHFARAKATKNGFELIRDPLGVSPLYFGKTTEGDLCFASEVKGLLEVTRDIHELPPGHMYAESKLEPFYILAKKKTAPDSADKAAKNLRSRLETSVLNRIGDRNVGAWLSGGIDSSALAAIARPYLHEFHTFAAGMPDSPDLEFAELAAEHISSRHHALVVTQNEILSVIPEVIYHLETFDAYLIRSSLLNFLVAKLASDYVPAVFSGEGGDELFAGYEYLSSIPHEKIPDELIDIIGRLHNTALQRVDRSASAHGLVAYVGFLDQDVVDYALQIPAEYKIRNGVEKWILRKSVEDLLPTEILWRKKAKFWQGAGVQDFIAKYADERISSADFKIERNLKNGSVLNSKEELLYYRIFTEHFGEFDNLSWMGRTKGVPVE